MFNFSNYKILTVGRIIYVELCHHAKVRGDRSNCCRDISILDFLRWRQPPSWIFNDRICQEGRTVPKFVEIVQTM